MDRTEVYPYLVNVLMGRTKKRDLARRKRKGSRLGNIFGDAVVEVSPKELTKTCDVTRH